MTSNSTQISSCLLRNLDESFCEPTNSLFIGLHGFNGKGGREANANIPEDYRGLLIGDSPVKDAQPSVYSSLDKYVGSFDKQFADVKQTLRLEGQTENQIRIKSLYLWSESPGTGKTTSAVALLNEYLVRHYIGNLKRGISPKQTPCYFLDVNELQTQYNQFNRPKVPQDIAEKAADSYYRAIEKAKYTEFVVCDDIGVRESTEGWRGDLHSVVNHRVTNRKPTIYTSNIPIEELAEVFNDPRLPDRVRDMTQEFWFSGESARGKRK